MRASGRTTRMLQYAIEKAKEGNRVHVYGASKFQADWLFRKAAELLDGQGRVVEKRHIQYNGSIKFKAVRPTFDEIAYVKRGFDGISLFDHFVEELALGLPERVKEK